MTEYSPSISLSGDFYLPSLPGGDTRHSGRGFHATTAYDILRMLGVKIGKMDYLGQMRMGG